MSRNGVFTYSGGSFEVYVISFSYPWKLETRSSSQARQRQTIYPFRAAAGDLNVRLQFRSRQELREFGMFARDYHLAVTSSAGQVGSSVPDMRFIFKPEPNRTKEYSVALPSIPVSQSNDMVAPEISLQLKILADYDGMGYDKTFATSSANRSLREAVEMNRITRKVTSSSVASSGDNAYSSSTSFVGKVASKIQSRVSQL